MKKKVIGIALMAIALTGFTGMAQTAEQKSKAQIENVKTKKGEKKALKEKKDPFEGLTLTEAQKSKLAELESRRQSERQAKMEGRQNQADGKKDGRTLSEADKKAKMEARKTSKEEYLKEVKAIIGPDQYVMFLENMYINAGGHHHGGKAIRQGKGSKQALAHNKSGKVNRQAKGGKGSKTRTADKK